MKVNREIFYLNQKYDEKVEVGNSPELLKHILRDEVPKCVLETRDSQTIHECQSLNPST